MPWNLGNFIRQFSWQADRDNQVKIRADRMDAEFDNYKAGMEQLLLRNGDNQPTKDIDWGGHKITNAAVGTEPTDYVTFSQIQNLGGGGGNGGGGGGGGTPSSGGGGNTNLLRNGEFRIAQRGPIAHDADIGADKPFLDGWVQGPFIGDQNFGTYTITQSDLPPGFDNSQGKLTGAVFSKCMKWHQTVAATTTEMNFHQRLEDPKRFNGQHVGGIFYRMVNAAAIDFPDPKVTFGIYYGTGGSPSATTVQVLPLVSPPTLTAGLVQKYQFLSAIPINAGGTFGTNGDGFAYLTISVTTGGYSKLFDAYFSGISLIGSDGTLYPSTYLNRDVAADLAMCQRYYENSFLPGATPGDGTAAYATVIGVPLTAALVQFTFPFKVTKRVSPTLRIYRTSLSVVDGRPAYLSGGSWVAMTSVNNVNPSVYSFHVDGGGSYTANAVPVACNWTATDPVFG